MFTTFSGKKTEPVKTKITEYCHDEFLRLCGFFVTTPAAIIRTLVVLTLIAWKHPRFEDALQKAKTSDLNERGIINDIIKAYLGDEKSNVVNIDQIKNS